MAVGDLQEWSRSRRDIPADGKIAITDFRSVTEELFQLIDRIWCFHRCWRAASNASIWRRCCAPWGFEGRHRAIEDMLPNPEIVRRGIVDLCPGLDFGVIMIPARSTLTHRRRRRRPA